MLEITVTLLLRVIGSSVVINPITLDFLRHYVFGKQQPRRLPSELLKFTRLHVIKTLVNKAAFSPSTLWGHAECYPHKGNISWYTHPTRGVVGGFIYRLISYEDAFVVRCQDEFDFNLQTYQIPLPEGLDKSLVKPILKRLGGAFVPIYGEDGDVESYGVSESWLTQFNEAHRFTTTWELELPSGMCMPINHPLKRSWGAEQCSRRTRRSRFRPW